MIKISEEKSRIIGIELLIKNIGKENTAVFFFFFKRRYFNRKISQGRGRQKLPHSHIESMKMTIPKYKPEINYFIYCIYK